MKIFKAEDLIHPIQDLDLGILQAGEEKDFEFIVVNDSEAILNKLEFSVDNKEIKIISFPKSLKANERANFFVKWSPSITVKQGLKASVKITGYEIWS